MIRRSKWLNVVVPAVAGLCAAVLMFGGAQAQVSGPEMLDPVAARQHGRVRPHVADRPRVPRRRTTCSCSRRTPAA